MGKLYHGKREMSIFFFCAPPGSPVPPERGGLCGVLEGGGEGSGLDLGQDVIPELLGPGGEEAGAGYDHEEVPVGARVADGAEDGAGGGQLRVEGEDGHAEAPGDQVGDGVILPHAAQDDGVQALGQKEIFQIVGLVHREDQGVRTDLPKADGGVPGQGMRGREHQGQGQRISGEKTSSGWLLM